AKEVLLRPGEFKASLLGLQNFGHIATNHPPNVDANLFLFSSTYAHERPPPSRHERAEPPIRGGCATLLLASRLESAAKDRSGGMLGERRTIRPSSTTAPDLSNAADPA